jgi:hypothetical protein
VNDDTDLDRLFARLSGEGHAPDPDDHPAPEKLSAYQANELSAEEDDAIQEHLVHCARCTELLLDLQRFLDPPPEDLPREGVADFETAAQWREVRRRIGEEKALPVAAKRGLLTGFFSPALAAVLALLLIGAAIQVVRLERELAEPITDLTPTTIEAPGTHKGAPVPAGFTPFRLGHVAAFDTHSPQPYLRFSLIFRDKNGQVKNTVEARENDEGMIVLFLPRRFVAPGTYSVEVQGEGGASSTPIRKFDIQILQ